MTANEVLYAFPLKESGEILRRVFIEAQRKAIV